MSFQKSRLLSSIVWSESKNILKFRLTAFDCIAVEDIKYVNRNIIYSKFSSNSEANSSELPENLEYMFPRY